MAIDIALDDEEMQRRMQQVAPLAQIQAPPGVAPAKGAGQQLGEMAMPMVMSKGLDAAFAAGAGKGVAGGTMAGAGAAMPYLGAGLLAGKALGFFSQGGFVGPLAKVEYKSNGGEVYKLSYGGPISKGV